MEGHARAALQGGTAADDPRIPTLVSVDGEIYLELLRHRLQALAPQRELIPPSADAPALATSPMVLMTTPALARGLRRADPFQALARHSDHRQLDPAGPPQPIRFVHTAPTRSNSGLQTVVAMFAEVSGKRPEQLGLDDVRAAAPAVAAIQKHVTRYGLFWASVGSVYESSVVAANSRREPGQDPLVAVYPQATYSSTMRAILPAAPWVSAREREAALLLIERLQQPGLQQLTSAQRSLQAYLAQLGPRDVVGLIDFDSEVRAPVVLRGGAQDAGKAAVFVGLLLAEGGTRLHDAVLAGRDWLRRTRRSGEILAVVVLTDGIDSGSRLPLQDLQEQLRRSGFGGDERIGVFTIGYGSSGEYDPTALRKIAESNGGEFVEGTPESILRRMEDLQLAF